MPRSKRYISLSAKVDKKKIYTLDDALKLVKETGKIGFDASVEAHIKLGIDLKKTDQAVRGNVNLPFGTGKQKKVAVFAEDEKAIHDSGADVIGNEEKIKEIKNSGKIDFDIAIATPAMMKLLAPAAKILGPKGLMPSPKAGTVVDLKMIAETVAGLKKGMVNFRNDDTGNIHQIVGKVSWPIAHLKENCQSFFAAVNKAKPANIKGIYVKSAYLTSTMGPSVRITI